MRLVTRDPSSLREFTNNAMNHHHGMQTVERFGAGIDPDQDGHVDELTVGDVTAATIFQAVGIDPAKHHDVGPRPVPLAKEDARPITAVLSS